MTDDFVHLHTHSEYSMLDGLGQIKNLVAEVKRLGQPGLALTDHGIMHGAIEFFRACSDADIKPIIGVESYQTVWGRPMDGRDSQFDRENYHLLLLAKNMTGYHNILKIASQSQLNGYYYKPRVDHEYLAAHAEGIVCTTGCLGAEVPQLIMHGKEREAYERLGWYVDVFGKENFFIELQEHSIPELIPVNKTLVPWATKFDIPLLATNDVHYVREEDSTPHEVLLCVQTGATMKSDKRMRLSDQSYFLKSRAQMEDTFRPLIDLPSSAYDNSLRIMEMCEVDLEDNEYHLPDIDIPEGFNYETYLRHLTEEGLQRRYGDRANDDAIQERKEFELSVIHGMGFDVYFLIVADLCNFALSRNIWWNVRGSGAGSLVAYCIGVTGLDPLKNSLIFERFLNPARVSMPDFDLDFPDDQREELIQYTIDKYGEDQVAQIVTYGRMKARAAIRDVGRAQEIDLHEVDRVAKMIPAIPGKPVTIQDVLTEGHEFYNPELVELYSQHSWVRDLLEMSMKLEGVARHAGIHPAAVVVTDRELTHYTPLMRSSKGGITQNIAQYEFPILESIGLLKVDFLGLSTLSIMREAGRLIQERHGLELNLGNIPFEGPETTEAFKLLSSGEVSGVFQVEGQGMRRVLTEMRPQIFEHIIATISLYRPGPLEYIPNFIRRLHGEEEVEFKHEMLESILGETLGICIYQEQIIQILTKLAGYSAGEADLVRRAVSKKKASEIEKHKKIFIEGCQKNNIPKETAVAIYGDIEFFARYGFNKCLPGDVEVMDAQTGRLIKIEDIYTDKAHLAETVTCDTDSLKLQSGSVSAVMDNGVKPVYRLTTALGRTIEATANHPFYTFDGWRLLEELEIGHQIATPRSLPVEGQAEWPEHEIITLGHLLAEGNLCHPHSVYFYSQDPAQCDDYVRAAESFDNVECSISIHKGTFSIYAKRIDRSLSPGIVLWAKELGIWGKKAPEKEIPSDVFTLTTPQIGLLISRMWEGDGHINSSDRSLFYATASERLARQLQHLLLRLSIISRLRTVEFSYKEGRIGYQLYITGNDNIANFREAIGVHFISDERKERLDKLVLDNPASTSVKDVIPMPIKELVRTAKERTGVTWIEMNDACGVAPREFYPTGAATKSGFTRQTIQRLADYFGDENLYKYAQSDIYWDRITQIEYIGEKQTYDLEVPNTHNFVANDILVHNSHAADYAVITVQTAYLKALYPVDYMAALLLIERNKTEKVVNFINECRRMGIEVLPPDINYSGMDFEIQERPEGMEPTSFRDPHLAYDFPVPEGSSIRFGMAAIKNVGEGPVKVILDARQEGGPFKGLEDLCNRVDLRQVNKRSLECLVKVGALDGFGKRSQLLEVLDQMVAHSGGTHSARQSGQLSMFDMLGDDAAMEAAPIRLPDMEEAKGRDRLLWEKELLGVYAMSHPMQHLSIDMSKVVTCACNELNEQYHEKQVTMAGMISSVRTITTKKGDPMAFVQLEDLKGQCEVVVFPRTYADYKEKLEPDTVVLIKGQGQTREGQTSLLADTIQSYVDQAVAIGGEEENKYQPPLLESGPTINGMTLKEEGTDYQGGGTAAGIEQAADSSPTSGFSDGFISGVEELDFIPSAEENPFRNDVPTWMGATTEPTPPSDPTARNVELPNHQDAPPTKTLEIKNPPIQETSGNTPTADNTSLVQSDQILEKPIAVTAEYQTETKTNGVHKPSPNVGDSAEVDEPLQQVADHSDDLKQTVQSSETHSARPNGAISNGDQQDNTSVDRHNGQQMAKAPQAISPAPTPGSNGHQSENGHVQKSASISNGVTSQSKSKSNGSHTKAMSTIRELHIRFRRSGNLERDKFRLKQIYEEVRNSRGRDRFYICIESSGQRFQLAFPSDLCAINDRLLGELTKHFRVEVSVEEKE